jgi:hypothetical protein
MASYRCVYPFDAAALSDMAYFFEDVGGLSPAVAIHAYRSEQMVKRWWSDFWRQQRPQLVIEADDGETIRIRDTRSCAKAEAHVLQGPLAVLFRALETPVTRDGIRGRLRAGGWTPADEGELCELIDELLEPRLIWRSSTQYVALPTPPPRRPLSQSLAMGAMGEVQIKRYLRESRQRGELLANRAPRQGG